MTSSPKNAASKVVVRKRIKAKREIVYEAWITSDLMQQWMYPGEGTAITKNNPVVGGTYSHEMIFDRPPSGASLIKEDVQQTEKFRYLHTGEYLEVSPPARLVFTWSSPAVKNSKVTVEFFELGAETEIILTHEILPDEDSCREHRLGWEQALLNLAALLG